MQNQFCTDHKTNTQSLYYNKKKQSTLKFTAQQNK